MRGKFSFNTYSKPIILIAFIVVLWLLAGGNFMNVSNIGSVLNSVSVIGIMVCGTIFVFLIGGIDLSIGALLGLTGVVCVEVINALGATPGSVFVGILAAVAVGALAGLFHGFIVTTFNIPAFLVTFATQTAFTGMSMVITGNKIVSCTQPALFTGIAATKILMLPLPIYFMLLMALISWFVLRRTVFGRQIYAVGGNPTAAEISGINVKGRSIACYVLSGVAAAIGGVVLASMNQQGMTSQGADYVNSVITAGVIGGVSLLGGEGTVPGAMYGTVLMGLLTNGLNLMGVDSTQAGLVTGVVTIAAVALDAAQHLDQSKRKAGGLFAGLMKRKDVAAS